MTHRIFIIILLLVTVSLVNNANAGQLNINTGSIENNQTSIEKSTTPDQAPVKNMPVFPAPKPEAPHHKTAHAPQMDEVPHIHKYHKERVKKVKQHHTKLWFLGQFIVVLCQLSLLLIAYMHVIH